MSFPILVGGPSSASLGTVFSEGWALWLVFCCVPLATANARTGDWGAPIEITSFPFFHRGDTSPRPPSRVAAYDCAPELSEDGPEVVYQLTVDREGVLTVQVEGDRGAVDIDVHLLSEQRLSGAEAQGCLARDNRMISEPIGPGVYLLTVDTYQAPERAGPYLLQVDFEPEGDWYRRPVAEGVSVETKRYDDLFGGDQAGSVLRIDLAREGVEVKPVAANGCQTTSDLAHSVGAVAAINGGFFDGRCSSVSLLKIDGQVLARNARGRSAFGLTADGVPLIEWVAAGADWPDAHHALGGVSRLARANAVDVEWERDGAAHGFTHSAHPRTGVGIGIDGEIIMATLDGRTAAGRGVSLFDFGQWLVWLGADEALNLDGGGSTTMWTAPHGVVNFPSDNGIADHAGERGVSTVLAVFAPALNRPTEFTVVALEEVLEVGVLGTLEIFARDPDGGEIVLSGRSSGAGVARMSDRGDGTGTLTYQPSPNDPREVTLEVEAHVAGVRDGRWSLGMEVVGGQDPEEEDPVMNSDGGLDAEMDLAIADVSVDGTAVDGTAVDGTAVDGQQDRPEADVGRVTDIETEEPMPMETSDRGPLPSRHDGGHGRDDGHPVPRGPGEMPGADASQDEIHCQQGSTGGQGLFGALLLALWWVRRNHTRGTGGRG